MTHSNRKSPQPMIAKLARCLGFASFYERFISNVRLGNQPDMPTITTDRLWFLRENRFLFFTRDGPIEVTLKPSFVLTGILVCMAGVAAIFYSTLIASYSAIEVMRDESIQTAEASIGKRQADIATGNEITWQSYQASISPEQPPTETYGKRTQPFKPIVIPNNDRPGDFTLQTPNNDDNWASEDKDDLPLIIQGGKRVTLVSEKEVASPTIPVSAPSSREPANSNEITSFSNKKDVVSEPLLADSSDYPIEANQYQDIGPNTPANVKSRATAILLEETKAKTAPLTPSAREQEITKSETKAPSLSARIQKLASALVPNFETKQQTDANRTERYAKTRDQTSSLSSAKNVPPTPSMPLDNKNLTAPDTALIIPDGGRSTDKPDTHLGPVLPVFSEGARNKKLFRAMKQEIDYIRSTVTSLGIFEKELPAPLLLNHQESEKTSDGEFRTLMIKLAEHRAALRKIPFKPPMLYFYISSGYGMRKHPKTGKKAFHHGIDLAGTWQENVRATAPGTVISAGTEGSFGKVVRVQHEFDVVTAYAHLSRITVRNGDYVGVNHVIGKMGSTGKSAGMHLHYEIRVNGKSIDPNKFLTVGRQLSVAGELQQSSFIE